MKQLIKKLLEEIKEFFPSRNKTLPVEFVRVTEQFDEVKRSPFKNNGMSHQRYQ